MTVNTVEKRNTSGLKHVTLDSSLGRLSVVTGHMRIDLPQFLSVYFHGPADVHVDNLPKRPDNLYIAHDMPMWLDLKGHAVVDYVVEVPNLESVAFREMHVSPLEDSLEMNLTGGRYIPELDVLNRQYLLSLISPKLVVVRSKGKTEHYLDIDNVNIRLNGGNGMRLVSEGIPFVPKGDSQTYALR